MPFDTVVAPGEMPGDCAAALDELRRALAPWAGGHAGVWGYHVSHQWLTIVLTRQGVAGNLHLFCGVCSRVEFDGEWEPTNIDVFETADPEGYPQIAVQDGAHLKVLCGEVTTKRDVEPLYDSPESCPAPGSEEEDEAESPPALGL